MWVNVKDIVLAIYRIALGILLDFVNCSAQNSIAKMLAYMASPLTPNGCLNMRVVSDLNKFN